MRCTAVYLPASEKVARLSRIFSSGSRAGITTPRILSRPTARFDHHDGHRRERDRSSSPSSNRPFEHRSRSLLFRCWHDAARPVRFYDSEQIIRVASLRCAPQHGHFTSGSGRIKWQFSVSPFRLVLLQILNRVSELRQGRWFGRISQPHV